MRWEEREQKLGSGCPSPHDVHPTRMHPPNKKKEVIVMAGQAETERAAETAPKDRTDEQKRIVNEAVSAGRTDIINKDHKAREDARFNW